MGYWLPLFLLRLVAVPLLVTRVIPSVEGLAFGGGRSPARVVRTPRPR